MSERYLPQWRYSPSGDALLWKIMFLEPDILVCENRLQEISKTFFTCISIRSGKEILKNFSLDEQIDRVTGEGRINGLETTRGNFFYIYGYQDNSPEHRGIWAVDPLKKEIVWARPEAAFVANLQDSMLVYTAGSFAGFPERSYSLLDVKDGKVIETIGEDAEKANGLRRESLSDEELQNVVLPVMQAPGTLFPGQSKEELGEYIEHDGLLITVIHAPPGKEGRGFDATIRGYCNGIKVYEDVLAKGTAVPCVNYFLLRNVTLYYIKDMNELISVRF